MQSMTKYTPLEDRIVIKPIVSKELETTDGGIVVPVTVKKEVGKGEVCAVGLGRYAQETGTFVPTVLAKGDIVLYGLGQGIEIKVDGEDMRLMREGDVLMYLGKKEDNS